ncbi:phosphatase PAP2 family protein [Chryseobacterium sp. KC 927]|uniref:Phosphatase PAP2 family protein n=2 Tax=Chryseobacterium luquanense TaxID=2983766 RepID=A0ABT3XZ99_9FLAO|nr:phosphatase PAP2 family protein [Chryseobacterium luquanense]
MQKNNLKKHSFINNLYRKNLIFFILLFCIFLLLTSFVKNDSLLSWDIYVSSAFQKYEHSVLENLMKGLSWLGYSPIAFLLICLTSLVFFIIKRKREAYLILSTILTGGISWVLKMLIDRPRPGTDFVRIVQETHFQSFPSGHVLFYTVYFGLLSVIIGYNKALNQTKKRVFISLMVLMLILGAMSRIYLGAHWFTDVMGGFIVGLQFIIVATTLYLKKDVKIETGSSY